MEPNNITVIILTKNEEMDLPRCLDALSWCDDVLILDSGSTDNTIEIAKSRKASVFVHQFESFGKQRNYALDNLPIKHNWILFLDADEVASSTFVQEIISTTKNTQSDVAGFYCCWKMMLDDVWLKRTDNFPKWQFRLLRKGMARFTDFGHGQKEGEVNGAIEYIKEPYIHYGFSKGWTNWLDRHNKYSSLEAESRLKVNASWKEILKNKNSSKRNILLKSKLSRLPGWPFLRFFQSYVLKLGFFEGIPGLIYCINISYYEFLIQLKMRELRLKKI